MRWLGRAWLGGLLAAVSLVAPAQDAPAEAPLIIGSREVHVFRAPIGDISAEERARAAEGHVRRALAEGGEGWTSILPTEAGILVQIDGRPIFTVVEGDARATLHERPEQLANDASRVLQRVWAEQRERGAGGVNWVAVGWSICVVGLAGLLVLLLHRLNTLFEQKVEQRVASRLKLTLNQRIGWRASRPLLGVLARVGDVLAWLGSLVVLFGATVFVLRQFALTRPLGDQALHSLQATLREGGAAVTGALPGLVVAVLIFLLARFATAISTGVFDRIRHGQAHLGAIDAHTAPAARYLVNGAIWLFALAMAYPYLPGSQTEAFKGLSVLLGVMVSIGASGLVGQVASGMILVFTRALKVGEYVCIQEHEGVVTDLGLSVTRLRTAGGQELALPNALVLGQVTRNHSRQAAGGGFMVETDISIGYDTDWRQVEGLLREAAARVPEIAAEPPPRVLTTGLADFYVGYRLCATVASPKGLSRPEILHRLHGAILDVFNAHGVQIMSPHYVADPAQPKWVRPAADVTKP